MNTKTEMRQAIAQALITWREKRGFTSKVLAAKIGVKQKTYEAYEQKRCVPKIQILVKLAKFYSISVDALIDSQTLMNT